jgi:flavin reductase (DIM6/NTAB) family NADH-FMN oxidoreductase RutF
MKKSIGANTIVFPAPVFVVGTYDKDGKANAMTASWAGICCSKPPCIYVSLREATYTYGNIVSRKAFTVSIPSQKYIKQADYFGLVPEFNAQFLPSVLQRSAASSKRMVVKMRSSGSIQLSILRDAQRQLGIV